ncbi:MAG: glycoside hydrolase family 15 protein [Gemmataceae bacterium]|nr:glycoside hydrolase family 15 protein [Gemmataceae bacterium]
MPLPRIEDYALLGDCQTCALVARDGSVDWMCVPDFDSPACFAALLGTAEQGRWIIAPEGGEPAGRSYRDGTLALETRFRAPGGEMALIDCMPIRSREADLVRIAACTAGRVRVRMELVPRFDYGSLAPWIRLNGRGAQAVAGPDALLLETPAPLEKAEGRLTAEFVLEAGQRMPFALRYHRSHLPAPEPLDAEEAVSATEMWWRDWVGRCTYEGEWRDAVVRSLVTLKGLTYAPTGGIVAAATASLPERIGGVRNWDYRYCWVRDATFTLQALMENGYVGEARAWRDWLFRAVAGDPSQMSSMYGVDGRRRLPELELPWLPGYEGSKPVRVGNAAHRQFQLDVFGEAVDSFYQAACAGVEPHEDAERMRRVLADHLAEAWKEPDEGIWEVRGPRRHFVHSKVMAWVAFDRLARSVRRFGLEGPADEWRRQADEIHAEVCEKGFDARRNTFVQHYGAEALDASLLMIPLVGFLPAEDPRVAGTVDAVRRELAKDGFLARYPTRTGVDGLPPGEGAFLACSFWLADCLHLLGREEEARELFGRLLGLRNDVGLLAEQYDPSARRMLGNFPQAFSHVGLVNTAGNLSRPAGPAARRRGC